MSKNLRPSLGFVWVLLFGLLPSQTSYAAFQGEWVKLDGQLAYEISVADQLTPQQKKLIYSGFTTYSNLQLRITRKDGSSSTVFVSECTVSFDLWEEKFDLTGFLEQTYVKTLRTFKDYADTCLKARIGRLNAASGLDGSRLDIRLEISQVSQDFAGEVREWLIQQQSGVMRGLFAHMLGELKLSEALELTLVPRNPVPRS